MLGPVHRLLQEDHERLDALLARAAGDGGAVDREAYAAFCAGLLRHVAMEEKVLLPEARRLRGGVPLEAARRLRADHAALAALCVPAPTQRILATLRDVLREHNPLEEGPDGVYAEVERLVGDDAAALAARLAAVPPVRVAQHCDGPSIAAHVEHLLRAREDVR